MTYYKATRPDGTSFRDGKTTWTVGDTTKIPEKDRRIDLCGIGILHASDAPGETLLGGSWPCRLFEVEGDPVAQEGHKVGFHELTVVRELPAWQALGPNGEAVAAHIERCKTITNDQAHRMNAAWGATWGATRDAALAATWDAALAAARDAALAAAWDIERCKTITNDQAHRMNAARDAALALVVRDLITPDQFDLLYGPWRSVMEAGI